VPLAAPARSRSLRWAAPVVAVGLGLALLDLPQVEWRLPEPGGAPAPEPTPALVAAVTPRAYTPAPPPAGEQAAALERRLAALPAGESLGAALDAVFAAWDAPRTRPDELGPATPLDALANRRGLEDLHLTSNLSMLRLLDLPAVLELRASETGDVAYAALLGIDDEAVALQVGPDVVRVPPGVLDGVWFGDAHVFWRDFEWLGPTFGREAQGAHVARLQHLLTRAGVFQGPTNGVFGDVTAAAVVEFQRSRRLDADCRIGRLTRIALYGAAGTYKMPTLSRGGPS
jgi:hypothetical protein